MIDWSGGYNTQAQYRGKYQAALSPSRMRLVCLLCGVDFVESARPTYLELGSGEGVTVGFNAATNPIDFWCTDFMPAHVAETRSMLDGAGVEAVALEDSFEALAERRDLPQFDYIALHGVWSWVNAHNRALLVEIIARHLKPGGLCMVSYNTTAGRAVTAPIRDLMLAIHDHATVPSAPAEEKAAEILETLRGLAQLNLPLLNLELLRSWLNTIANSSLDYLVHEYFNHDWYLTSFPEVDRALQEAKLAFVGPMVLKDLVPTLLPAALGDVIAQASGLAVQQALRDFLTGQTFRRDLFIKGRRVLNPTEQSSRFLAQHFVACQPVANLQRQVPQMAGDIPLDARVVDALADLFWADGLPALTFRDVLRAPALQGVSPDLVRDTLMAQLSAGVLAPVQEEAAVARCQPSAQRLNHWLQARTREGRGRDQVASALVGEALTLGGLDPAFLSVWDRPQEERVAAVLRQVRAQGLSLKTGEGQPVTAAAEHAMVSQEYHTFVQDRLPILRRHGVVA